MFEIDKHYYENLTTDKVDAILTDLTASKGTNNGK
jgi:hypothetical protein